MDWASTAFDSSEADGGNDCTTSDSINLVLVSDEDLTSDCGPTEDRYAELLGLVEAQIELIDRHLYEIETKRKGLSEKKSVLENRMEQDQRRDRPQRNRVPVIQYLPPYFKDENMMCPPLNEEAKHKLRYNTFDPLIKEDKKWSSNELRLLQESVKNSLIQADIQKFIDRKEILGSKMLRAGAEKTSEELKAWKEEIEALDRKIQHSHAAQVDSREVDVVDYSCVDWMKISTVEFKGTRSAAALKYKWLNEQCPQWNSGTWTEEELVRLKQLREEKSFTSWVALAKELGTDRTPYQCFEKYRSHFFKSTKEWTKEEDDRLVALVKIMSVNDMVQWDKVCFYMPGRSRQQVRTRYQRTLDENVRHGRWTGYEDLLLMSAVAQFGAKDWAKVAKCVVGRSDGQCRERWCNVLDRCTETNDWMAEEDERLVLGVQVFGRGQWAKIAEILPRHKPENIRRRYQHLLSTKMRICSAKLVGYPVVCNMSPIVAAVHKAKRDVMRQQLTDDSIKGKFYRAAKQQAEKNQSAKMSNIRRGNKFSDEEKALLEKGIEEITKKFRNGDHTPSVADVIKNIDLTQKEVATLITAAQRCSTAEGAKRAYRRTGGLKKIRKNVYLLPDTLCERTVFRPEETEEERIICLTEALCHAVRKYDQHEWCNRFFAGRDEAEKVASNFITDMLSNRCVEVANRLKQCVPLPTGTTLPPTFTTTSAYRVFERARLSLTERASCYFSPNSAAATNVLGMSHGGIARKFTVHDRLNIQLHPDILRDDNYLKLKAQVRSLLREPTRLALAIDPPDVEEQRNRAQMELMQTIMDEQSFPYEQYGLNDVANEVVISSTDHCGPIHYEDRVDDALNETVNTVMDRVFNRSPKKKKKRGTPSRKDRLHHILADSQKESDTSERRVLPPRSAKKSRSSFAGGSSVAYDFELDFEGSVDLSPLASERVSNGNNISKRKRGRSKKVVAVDNTQEVQRVELQSKRRREL